MAIGTSASGRGGYAGADPYRRRRSGPAAPGGAWRGPRLRRAGGADRRAPRPAFPPPTTPAAAAPTAASPTTASRPTRHPPECHREEHSDEAISRGRRPGPRHQRHRAPAEDARAALEAAGWFAGREVRL